MQLVIAGPGFAFRVYEQIGVPGHAGGRRFLLWNGKNFKNRLIFFFSTSDAFPF
jgi:hypothetical protein